MKKVGYARVSTDEQSLALQVDALKAAGCEPIFTDDGVSGAKAPESREGFAAALDALSSGNAFVVWKLDRMGRSLSGLIALLALFEEKGVEFVSLTDGIDTTTPGGRLVYQIMGALAEFERGIIQERTRAGLQAARKRGKRLGRPLALTGAQVDHACQEIDAGRETISGMAELFGVDRNTLRRAIVRQGKMPPPSSRRASQ